jgi:hypothetical protein
MRVVWIRDVSLTMFFCLPSWSVYLNSSMLPRISIIQYHTGTETSVRYVEDCRYGML